MKDKQYANMEAETQKHKTRQGRSIWYKWNKETEAKGLKLGFFGISICAHIRPTYAAQLYAYAYTP